MRPARESSSALAPTTQAEYAYQWLRRDIITGQLEAGARIKQADWAETMGLSVTPLREAIRRLEQDGLVESAPHKGVTVIGLNLDRAEEIYAMRFLVEPLQIRRTMGQMTSEDHRYARELCDRMQVTRDIIEFTELNEIFHRVTMVYDESWTARIVEMLANASAPYVSFSLKHRPEQIPESNAVHYEILEACIDGDVEAAVRLELEHIGSTIEILRTY